MGNWLKDLQFGARLVRKNPGVFALSIVALTLGIGLTTAMFSITYGALYRGLPVANAERVLHLERNNLARNITSMEVTVHDFHDWREQQTSFTGLAAFYTGTVNVAGLEGRPERFDGAFITANAFAVLGVTPLLGRTFQEGEDRPGSAPVMIIGYRVWQDHFNADPNVIGRTIRYNGDVGEVIGVMHEGFRFPISEDVWVPLRLDPLTIVRGQGMTLEVFGRLHPGLSQDQASVEFATIAARLAETYPETNEGVGVVMKPYAEEYIGEEPATLLLTMMAAVFLVLLIACANVANLLLARAAARSKEVAVRTAIGASRGRIVRQFLTETFVVAGAGTALGLFLAWFGVRMFNQAIAPTNPPYWIDIRLDAVALAFAVGLAVLATVLAGVLPALKISAGDVNEVLKDESRGSSSLRLGKLSRILIVGEIALSCGLLVAAGLMIKSVTQLNNVDYGFEAAEYFTARVGLFETDYPTPLERRQFWEALHERMAALPGVRAAALTTNLPGLGANGTRIGIEGATYERDQDRPAVRFAVVTPGFFEALGVAALQGRLLDRSDNDGNLPVAVVNESFVRDHFPDGDVLGRRFQQGAGNWRTIVGVVPDIWMDGIEQDPGDTDGFYMPLAQADFRFMSIMLHTAGDPMQMTATVRDEVLRIDADLPIYFVSRLDASVLQDVWFFNVFGILFMVFGAAALFLGGVGLYGVMSFTVGRRTQEMGIRMALGASTRSILALVLKQGMWQLGIGLTLGLGIAALLSNGLQIVLFQVEPFDPVIFVLVSLVLFLSGTLATLIPARRATRVDPMVALRYE
ncbi:MAG: ABC transporter permease [Gemmatimonadales bacterium]